MKLSLTGRFPRIKSSCCRLQDCQLVGLMLISFAACHNEIRRSKARVSVREAYPIYGNPYFFFCDINSLQPEDIDVFAVSGVNMGLSTTSIIPDNCPDCCLVQSWKYCDQPMPELSNKSCGCHKKELKNDGFTFTFFFYLAEASKDQSSLMFVCKIIGHTSERAQIYMVDFTDRPPSLFYGCRNSDVLLTWSYKPGKDFIRERFKVDKVTWTSVGKKRKNLGFYQSGSPFRHMDMPGNSIIMGPSDRIPTLNMSDLQEFDNKQIIWINVTFIVASPEKKGEIMEDLILESEAHDDNITVTTHGPDVALTPAPINKELNNEWRNLVSNITFFIVQEPPAGIKITLSVTESLTGQLLVGCGTSDKTNFGDPPVNLTIWRDEEVLVSKEGVSNIPYMTERQGDAILCGLSGPALKCLCVNKTSQDNRCRPEIKLLTDVGKIDTEDENPFDLLLSMYTWQCLVCLFLMLWASSLVLSHLQLLISRRKQHMTENMVEAVERRVSLEELRSKARTRRFFKMAHKK